MVLKNTLQIANVKFEVPNMIHPIKGPQRIINKLIKTFLILNTHLHQPSFKHQEKFILGLISKCKDTVFGRKYGFKDIKTIEDFQNMVPISHYKDFEPWIMYMLKGEKNITYPGKIDRFATSSGTTWGTAKYIPITKANLRESHFKGGLESLSLYIRNNPRTQFLQGKGLVIWWSFTQNPYTGEQNVGFISAILQKTAPRIGQHFRYPRAEVSFMDNREEKTRMMIEEWLDENITFFNGQPSWWSNFMYKVLEYTGKKNILEIRPNMELFFRWGMAIDLYKPQFQKLFPSPKMKYYQVYNASEWFFAVQDSNFADDMRLLTNHGVFYEFIPFEEYGKENPTVLTLKEVEINKEYVIMITNNSWLWRYVLWDTVRFTCLEPWRIKISGRTKYYIDVVGECVTSDYTDKALLEACKQTDTIATDYMLAPITYSGGSVRGAYERIIEFTKAPKDDQEFTRVLDKELCDINSYYYDERYDTKVLGDPLVHCVKQGTFYERLKSRNKLGGQHKIPKVFNDRKNLDEILALMKK